MTEPIKTPRTYAAAAVSFDRLMQESEQMETELTQAQAERDALRAEVATLNTKLSDSYPQRYVDGLNAEIRNLRSELAEARKDSERLRTAILGAIDISSGNGEQPPSLFRVEEHLRAAIDASKGAE